MPAYSLDLPRLAAAVASGALTPPPVDVDIAAVTISTF